MKDISRQAIFLAVMSTVFSHSVWAQNKLTFIQRATSPSPQISTVVSRTAAARTLTSSVQGRDLPEGPPHIKPKYYYFNHAACQMEASAPPWSVRVRSGKVSPTVNFNGMGISTA